MQDLIAAADRRAWRAALAAFERVDVCQLPEYHQAYARRFPGAEALLWRYRAGENSLCYPFLLTPVVLRGAGGEARDTGWRDISGIYGYSGPLASRADADFRAEAWRAFDSWAAGQKVLCEFIRFSAWVGNRDLAHPAVSVEYNRPVAIAELPADRDAWLARLGGKTRNMLRKAARAGLAARMVDARAAMPAFRALYVETMTRNRASEFFAYDDAYYDFLLELPPGELLLAAVYRGPEMVAAALGLAHRGMAFYHLGASTRDGSRDGAGNLALFELAACLIERGIGYFSVGGGRGTAPDDPLYRFKRSNASTEDGFYIGKRVHDAEAYARVVKTWETMNDTRLTGPNLQFYR